MSTDASAMYSLCPYHHAQFTAYALENSTNKLDIAVCLQFQLNRQSNRTTDLDYFGNNYIRT